MDKSILTPLLPCNHASGNSPQSDAVNHPAHYNNGKIECIEAICEATEHLTGYEGMLTGNAIKYLWRWKLKSKPVEDLEKAVWYIQRLIGYLKRKQDAAAPATT